MADAVCLALGVTGDGQREVLGLWIAGNQGPKFWPSVMTELRNRGVEDILIAVVDGLKGFPDAINSAFPETTVQTCVRHRSRTNGDKCLTASRPPLAELHSSGKQRPTLFSDPPHLEGPQGRRREAPRGLQRRDRRAGPGRPGGVRRGPGPAISLDRAGLAPGLGRGD